MALNIWFHATLGTTGHGQNAGISKRPAADAIVEDTGGAGTFPTGTPILEILPDADHTMYIYGPDVVGSPQELKQCMALTAGNREWVVVPDRGARYEIL